MRTPLLILYFVMASKRTSLLFGKGNDSGPPDVRNQPNISKEKRSSALFGGSTKQTVYLPFRPAKKYPEGTTMQNLLILAERNLDEGRPKATSVVPPGVSTNEWLAAHTFLFYNQANYYYGYLNDQWCKCEKMTIGSKYEYLWADGKTIRNPINIPANDYIDYLMTWIEANLSDARLFPEYEGAKYSKEFTDTIKSIFKRIFRVFGHMAVEHEKQLREMGKWDDMMMVVRCFVVFVKMYKLMDKKQLKPLHRIIESFKEEK